MKRERWRPGQTYFLCRKRVNVDFYSNASPDTYAPHACAHRWASVAASRWALFATWGCTPETYCCSPHQTHSCRPRCPLSHPCHLLKPQHTQRKQWDARGTKSRQSACGRMKTLRYRGAEGLSTGREDLHFWCLAVWSVCVNRMEGSENVHESVVDSISNLHCCSGTLIYAQLS